MSATTPFLPVTRAEMESRGWDAVDVVLVTGDAYIDHPSFGVAVIGRWLESHGFRVALLSQPRHDGPGDFTRFGRPRLFFGVTAGNLDSVVANYSGNARVRDVDDFSPGGDPYFDGRREKAHRRRPDRAAARYASLARAAFGDVPVVLGGIEASLRRFVHYDYQQARMRASALTDAKADLLVYGMGERAALEIARRLSRGEGLSGIDGTCERLTERERAGRDLGGGAVVLPSWEEISGESRLFLEAERTVDRHARSLSRAPLLQRQQALWVLQHPPAAPLGTAELDEVHGLAFRRAPHPSAGDVPAWRMIRHSVTIVRGCCGNCSFCAIARHQGPVVTSRSPASVVAEVREVAAMEDFSGTVSDLGGPTANLFGTSCASPSPCRRHDCLFPRVCRHLEVDEGRFLSLLEEAESVEGVRHLFVSSGLRMELLLRTPKLLERLVLRHTPGALKIAPEHTEARVLELMHKSGPGVLTDFLAACRAIAARHGREARFSPYFISSHPGCTRADMARLAAKAKRLGLPTRQVQDFTPTPGTMATAMYVAGLDARTLAPIHVARTAGERRAQREALADAPAPRRRKR